MQFNVIRPSTTLSAAPTPSMQEAQSIKGNSTSLAGATSEYQAIPGQAFESVQKAFGPLARQMLSLTAVG